MPFPKQGYMCKFEAIDTNPKCLFIYIYIYIYYYYYYYYYYSHANKTFIFTRKVPQFLTHLISVNTTKTQTLLHHKQIDKLCECLSCPSLCDYGKLSVKGIVSRDNQVTCDVIAGAWGKKF